MEKILKIGIGVVVLFIAFLLLKPVFEKWNESKDWSLAYEQRKSNLPENDGKLFPDFLFIPILGKQEKGNEFGIGKKKLVFYFNPTCGHCKKAAESVNMAEDLLKDTEIMFVSRMDTVLVREFANYYRLIKPNISFYFDPNEHFYNYFGMMHVPLYLLYDEEGHLIHQTEAELSVDDIVRYLNNTMPALLQDSQGNF